MTRMMPPGLIAEELDPGALAQQYTYYNATSTPRNDVLLAWNLLETGLQSPVTKGHRIEEAFDRMLLAKSEQSLPLPEEYKLRLAMAGRRAFFERADGFAPDASLFDHTYGEIGRVLQYVTHLNLHPTQEKGWLCELIAAEGILRAGKHFLHISSPREEESHDKGRNHDFYTLGHYDDYLKLGCSVKSEHAPKAAVSPTITMRMGRIVDSVLATDWQIREHLDQFPTEEAQALASYRHIADLFLKDQGNERLRPSEEHVLDHLGSALNARIGRYLEPVPQTRVPFYFDGPGDI